MPLPILISTTNPHKLREIQQLLFGLPFQFLTLNDFKNLGQAEETGNTFAENALIKARFAAEKTGLPTLAEDSGLEVETLERKPGIYSARYSGPNATDQSNLLQLLGDLKKLKIPWKHPARFVCVTAWVQPSPETIEKTFEGFLEGEISEVPRGKQGFGYDPIFYLPSLAKNLSELSNDEKNAISHRKHALLKFREWIQWHFNTR